MIGTTPLLGMGLRRDLRVVFSGAEAVANFEGSVRPV